jgi:DNA-directed RNA polymerase subunit RPC12/RpoP
METVSPVTQLLCPQCGGELHPDEGQIFLDCPYCGSTVFIDKSQVIFHWYLAPTLDEARAGGALRRWMAGNETVKDLDKKSTITQVTFGYFPVWHLKYRLNGDEAIFIELAAATSVSELRRIRLPAGDLKKYDSQLDAQAEPPTIPLQTALGWLVQRGPSGAAQGEIVEQFLVHIPLFTFKYTFKGQAFTAIVEAGTGAVFANIFPAKAETPYQAIGCVTALVYLVLAFIPLAGAALNGWTGTGLGLLGCIGVGLALAPLLFGLAVWIAAKV